MDLLDFRKRSWPDLWVTASYKVWRRRSLGGAEADGGELEARWEGDEGKDGVGEDGVSSEEAEGGAKSDAESIAEAIVNTVSMKTHTNNRGERSTK
jgi:hypothetical protein